MPNTPTAPGRLVQEVYGTERRPKYGPFSLRCAQTYEHGVVLRSAGWYNQFGERLGWGDLTLDNLVGIRSGIRLGEMFVALSGDDAYWGLLRDGVALNKLNAPGRDYVAARAIFVIVSGHIFETDLSGIHGDWAATQIGKRRLSTPLPALYLSRQSIGKLLTTGKLPPVI